MSFDGRRVKQFLSFEPSVCEASTDSHRYRGIGMMVPAKCDRDRWNSGGNAEKFRPEQPIVAVWGFLFYDKGGYVYEFQAFEVFRVS